jgi:multidrug efflux pump subunit AcrA (membrane-fusion protein)
MRLNTSLKALAGTVVLGGLITLGYFTRGLWLSWFEPAHSNAEQEGKHVAVSSNEVQIVKVTAQARSNLKLVSQPVKVDTYWRTIEVPGIIVDRPAQSDRGVVAPVTSVVTKVHSFPGDTVRPGDDLFTLRLLSESIHLTQSELFKTTQETRIIEEEKKRWSIADGKTISPGRGIDLDNQLRRLAVTAQAHRQELLSRGLTPEQIAGVAEGKYVSETVVLAPGSAEAVENSRASSPKGQLSNSIPPDRCFEVQELKVELGQQVQAGQTLGVLSNHRSLYIAGRSFRREAPHLERAAQGGWPVKVDFTEEDKSWPALEQTFAIHHLSNVVDPAARTFDFYLPLENESRAYQKDGKIYLVWRFRPGQRVRLLVPVEELKDVIVMPAGAVVREGPEAFVFQQNGDLFQRRPVQILYEDRLHVVLVNDGSLTAGMYLAQSSAASLNRILKAQNSAGGLPPGAHFHADGSLHIPGQ